jgi:putative SOS response-associated peptidase YedK
MTNADWALTVIGLVVLVVGWVVTRRGDRDLEHLRAGYIPPSWEAAYRRGHPDRRDETT